MDPTWASTRVNPLSFERNLLTEYRLTPPAGFSLTPALAASVQLSSGVATDTIPPEWAKQREALLATFSKLPESVRRNHNPLELLGKGPFMNRAAYKMANLNALFGLIPAANSAAPFYYADIAGGPGGWTEYVQSQLPHWAEGFGISLKSQDWSLNWNSQRLDYNAFQVYQEGKGDVITEWPQFVRFVQSRLAATKAVTGLALCMCDGGDEHEAATREAEHGALAFHELLLSVKLLRSGGNMVIKLYDTFLPLTRGIIFASACYFEAIHVVKLASSRATNTECYLVGLRKRASLVEGLESFLEQMGSYLAGPKFLELARSNPSFSSSSFAVFDKLPLEFNQWLQANTQERFGVQIAALTKLPSHYHAKKALQLWRVADVQVFNERGRTTGERKVQDKLLGPIRGLSTTDQENIMGRVQRLVGGYLSPAGVAEAIKVFATSTSGVELLTALRQLPVDIKQVSAGREAQRVKDISTTLDQLRIRVGADFRYLDVGAAEGKITAAVASYLGLAKSQAFATDILPQPESQAFTFTLVKDERLPFPDASFDLITCFMSLHHIGKIELMLNEIRRVAKPGALVIVREHDGTDPVMRIWFNLQHALYAASFERELSPEAFMANFQPETYASYRSPEAWHALFNVAGFRREGEIQRERGMSEAFYAVYGV